MKKIILLACISMTFIVSANTNKNLTEKPSKFESKIALKNSQKKSKKKTKVLINQPVYYTASCGLQVTTTPPDSWGWKELIHWASLIEQNYCQ